MVAGALQTRWYAPMFVPPSTLPRIACGSKYFPVAHISSAVLSTYAIGLAISRFQHRNELPDWSDGTAGVGCCAGSVTVTATQLLKITCSSSVTTPAL